MVSSTVILVIGRGASLGPTQGSKPGDILAMSTTGPAVSSGAKLGSGILRLSRFTKFPRWQAMAGARGPGRLFGTVSVIPCSFFSFCCNCPFTDSFVNPHVPILGLFCTAVQSLIFFGCPDLGKTNLSQSQNTMEEAVYIGF